MQKPERQWKKRHGYIKSPTDSNPEPLKKDSVATVVWICLISNKLMRMFISYSTLHVTPTKILGFLVPASEICASKFGNGFKDSPMGFFLERSPRGSSQLSISHSRGRR